MSKKPPKKKNYGNYGRKQVSLTPECYEILCEMREVLAEEMHMPVSLSNAASYAIRCAKQWRGMAK